MESVKTLGVERRLIIGLAGVVVVTLVAGEVRKRAESLARPSATPQANTLPLPAAQASEVSADTDTPASPRPAQDAPRPPAYLAQDLRDPLKPLLPEPGQLADPEAAPSHAESWPSPGFEPPDDRSDAAEAAPPALQVQGLVWGGPEPQAIINGRLYGVDDMVGGGRILAIDHHGVTIEHGGVLRFYAPASSASGSFDRFEQPMAGRFHQGR